MITNILEYKIVWVKSWGKSPDSAEGSLKNITYIEKVITQLNYPIEWGGLGISSLLLRGSTAIKILVALLP